MNVWHGMVWWFAIAAWAWSGLAVGQAKPIRVLVGVAAGGGVDAMSRLYAEKLREALGQPVIVENRAGASGLIAMDALRAAPADGQTLLFAPNGGVTLIPQTFRNPRFDPFKDIVPVAMVGKSEVVLVANAQTKASTVAEFVAKAKDDAQLRNFGAAPGTILHLGAALFGDAAGLALTHVPYKGAGQVITDVLGGVLAASVLTTGEAVPHERAGKVRMLATFGSARSALVPHVPTMTEAGYPLQVNAWFGFYATSGTPSATIDRFGQALVAASASAEVRERMATLGIEPAPMLSAEVVPIMRADYANWARAIKIAKLTPQD